MRLPRQHALALDAQAYMEKRHDGRKSPRWLAETGIFSQARQQHSSFRAYSANSSASCGHEARSRSIRLANRHRGTAMSASFESQ